MSLVKVYLVQKHLKKFNIIDLIEVMVIAMHSGGSPDLWI